ncbi:MULTISPECIES: SpoIIE family protein phosphatase [Streptomyces]|uniref:SpoIIE family protein phosphatase n=1 Tax=Streptomyces glycanivorans TaxID=3033808 RepID=A0ABY9JME2_9ACTN|nr:MULTISPECIES: SpoIIE family protein phosphatase [unclassified Streptomyces]WSQ77474.1 SpoIIE family protein phosphatase [Streptomyces sp. NBC_01213]WLQ68900.1 SpoIIE family protein phosphatase [Streptomyces sp. Alt3]WSQ84831.1 SpoIIE family protein phosphatase [Streptomyces sp. NBC_01212]WSR11418.1 SpoIIE family protein phosphatase [Streptomyces sp. NBC_01208]WSR52951.1 SpoIIE family protein phosphatase [Streptomyces sp. NBC_01201]
MNGGGGRARRLTRRLAVQNAGPRLLHPRRAEPAGPRGDRFTTAARMRWLNEASTRIGTSLDLERTAEELAAFSVPRLADAAAVDLLESVLHGEEGERVTGTAVPVTRAMAVRAIDALAELEPAPVGEVVNRLERRETLLTTECLRNGRPVLVGRMTARDYARVAPTDSAEAAMRRQGVHSYMAVPLIARGVLLGSADFVRAGDSPPFNRADLDLAGQLASMAAVFMDNARLYGREREHVVSLQRSLLPRATPHTPGLRVHAHYAPAVDAHGVGGDWYDVVALPSGRTALVVGDVTGHGLPAAATMGRLRTVARTLMMLDIAPDRLLARLDLATRDLEDDQVATCLCAVYDPADSSYTIASAGHPPPLLVDAGGTARYLDVPVGAPLGAGVIPYDPLRVRGPVGGRLVLYTDGLIKTRTDDVDVQLEGLRATVAAMAPEQLDSGGPLTLPRRDDGRFDEAVLLVAGGHELGPGVRLREWDLPTEGNPASTARKLVTEQLARWELGELADVTELVVSELVGNALRYGGGPGRLRLLLDERLQVELADTGPDLPQIQHADVSDEGGRGLQLINLLCRRWGSCRTANGKIVWAEQNVPGRDGDLPL